MSVRHIQIDLQPAIAEYFPSFFGQGLLPNLLAVIVPCAGSVVFVCMFSITWEIGVFGRLGRLVLRHVFAFYHFILVARLEITRFVGGPTLSVLAIL